MTKTTKIVLIFGMLAIFTLQIVNTTYLFTYWPFYSANYFYRHLPFDNFQYWIILHDDKGGKTKIFAGQAIPLDHLHSTGILKDVYIKSDDEERKFAYSQFLLSRLNNDPWNSFDEKMPAPIPSFPAKKFVKLDVVKYFYHFDQYKFPQPPVEYKREVIYTQPHKREI